jgi:hypothetical protein
MMRAKRLAKLEMPNGKKGVEWPTVFFYPTSGAIEEQAKFTRNIERRRLARQKCFVVGGEGGYATEEKAFHALCECFIG